MADITIKKYLEELRKHSSYNFCDYSDNSIHRRIEKILMDHKISMEELISKTKEDKYFVETLVDEITVNTTELFRNPELWSSLYKDILPKYKNKEKINIWHAGCSSGQEVYSNMILLNELNLLTKTDIVATDINKKMIKKAQEASYSYRLNKKYFETFNQLFGNIKNSKVTFEKYFQIDKTTDEIKVKKILAERPEFIKHDLVEQELPVYHNFDIIFCRNVLIYFNQELQMKIVKKFFDRLNTGGALILGSHESLHGFFKTKFRKQGAIYIKSGSFYFKQ